MCLSIFIILIVSGNTKNDKAPNSVYQVYLNGQKMGMIASKDELYDLINEEQRGIKEKYNVDKVYPPLGFEIVKYVTYDNDIVDANKIYDKIKDQDDFTIEGYKVTITSEEEGKEDIVINVLDENVFKNALKNVVTAFVSEDEFNKYINNTQSEIVDTGQLIEHMYFAEKININKKAKKSPVQGVKK